MGDIIGVCITYQVMEVVSWPLLNCRDDTYCHSLGKASSSDLLSGHQMLLPAMIKQAEKPELDPQT